MTILEIRAGDVASFAGAYQGALEPGASCTLDEECRAGFCRLESGALEGRCQQWVGDGQACDTSGDPLRVCVDLTAGPDSDDEFQTATNALFCVPDAGGATGSCQGSLQDGQPCDHHIQCASERCAGTGTCQAKLALGDTCQVHSDCESDNCSQPTLTCVEKVAVGGSCTAHTQCATGLCTGLYDSKTCTDGPLYQLGDPCVASNECETDVCSGGVCIPRLCREYVNRTF